MFILEERAFYNLFFFFSRRRRHTRSKRDWSSDVCSSDLDGPLLGRVLAVAVMPAGIQVKVDPEVGGAVELELLHVKSPVTHRRWPVDSVHGIAWPVLADAHDHRGGLQRALPRDDVPLE